MNPVGLLAVEELVRRRVAGPGRSARSPEDTAAMDLRDHLLSDHGREGSELAGLPLVAVHRFEHVEAELGLVSLAHHHRSRGSVRAAPRRRARRADL